MKWQWGPRAAEPVIWNGVNLFYNTEGDKSEKGNEGRKKIQRFPFRFQFVAGVFFFVLLFITHANDHCFILGPLICLLITNPNCRKMTVAYTGISVKNVKESPEYVDNELVTKHSKCVDCRGKVSRISRQDKGKVDIFCKNGGHHIPQVESRYIERHCHTGYFYSHRIKE